MDYYDKKYCILCYLFEDLKLVGNRTTACSNCIVKELNMSGRQSHSLDKIQHLAQVCTSLQTVEESDICFNCDENSLFRFQVGVCKMHYNRYLIHTLYGRCKTCNLRTHLISIGNHCLNRCLPCIKQFVKTCPPRVVSSTKCDLIIEYDDGILHLEIYGNLQEGSCGLCQKETDILGFREVRDLPKRFTWQTRYICLTCLEKRVNAIKDNKNIMF